MAARRGFGKKAKGKEQMIVAGLGQCSWDYLALVDDYPPIDTKKEVLQWHEQGGGPVATALTALSKLGVKCRFSGVTGDDEAGVKIHESLLKEGIDIQWLRKRKGAVSQAAFIAIEKDTAKRTIFWRRPSGIPLTADEVSDGFLDGIDFLLLDGLLVEASFAAAKKAGSLNIPVMLDAGRVRPGMLELASLCDYVVASGEFAWDLGLESTPGAVSKKKEDMAVKVLTVTMGDRGSVTASDSGAFHFPAFRVDALDTTGAGDVFHGGYAFGLLQGWGLRDTVAFASALAAIKCRHIGGRAGIPDLQDIIGFLDLQGHNLEKPLRHT